MATIEHSPREHGPRVSVITPVYNAGGHLRQALGSVATQTYRDLEIVLVDDGSTDPLTLQILQEAAAQPGVSLYRTKNGGPSAARNFAIERARGSVIVPLDADDYLAPTFVSETLQTLDQNPDLGIAFAWIEFVGGHRGVWRTGGFSIPELLSYCSLHVTATYRREVWADVGGYDPRFVDSCEDWDFWLGAAARGWKARCIPKVLSYYRRTHNSRAARAAERDRSGPLMRTLVEKHRDLYATHMTDALAGLYEEYAAMCLALERVYRHPAISIGLRLRGLFQREAAR